MHLDLELDKFNKQFYDAINNANAWSATFFENKSREDLNNPVHKSSKTMANTAHHKSVIEIASMIHSARPTFPPIHCLHLKIVFPHDSEKCGSTDGLHN